MGFADFGVGLFCLYARSWWPGSQLDKVLLGFQLTQLMVVTGCAMRTGCAMMGVGYGLQEVISSACERLFPRSRAHNYVVNIYEIANQRQERSGRRGGDA
jgi:hypothetical protein